MQILQLAAANFSSLRARRTSKTVVKCKLSRSRKQPSRHFVLVGRPKLWWNANLPRARATLSSFRAHRTSKTAVNQHRLRDLIADLCGLEPLRLWKLEREPPQAVRQAQAQRYAIQSSSWGAWLFKHPDPDKQSHKFPVVQWWRTFLLYRCILPEPIAVCPKSEAWGSDIEKINPDQAWSIILNLNFFKRKSCDFSIRRVDPYFNIGSISDQFFQPISDQSQDPYLGNAKFTWYSASPHTISKKIVEVVVGKLILFEFLYNISHGVSMCFISGR